MSRSLPIVGESAAIDFAKIHIASPCDQHWEDMHGDDRKRLCAQCDKHVHNFAQMTRDEIGLALDRELHTDEGLCARLFMRHDGTFLTADCEHTLSQKIWRRSRVHYYRSAATLLVGLSIIIAALIAAAPERRRAKSESFKVEHNEIAFKTKVSEMRRKADLLEKADWEAMLQYGGIGIHDAADLPDK